MLVGDGLNPEIFAVMSSKTGWAGRFLLPQISSHLVCIWAFYVRRFRLRPFVGVPRISGISGSSL